MADIAAGATSVLNGWGLKITPAKPVKDLIRANGVRAAVPAGAVPPA